MSRTKWVYPSLLFSLVLLLSASGCGSSGSGSRWNDQSGQGTAAGFSIDISGGAGTVWSGGDGDWGTGIWLDNYGPLGVKIYEAGTADASFTLDVPAATPDFGDEPLTVTADRTIPVYDDHPVDNNVYYFLRNEPYLYHKIDDSTPNAVTGIRVGAGATLTLPINADRNGSGSNESAYLFLENDLEILGTLRTAGFDDAVTQESGDPIDQAGLVLNTSGGVFVRPSGVLTTAGDNAATGRAGQGGAIEIVAYTSEGATRNEGILVNEGLIDASGGSTADRDAEGGNAAFFGGYGVNLYADLRFVNTGTIRADGGNGGTGGYAGGYSGNSVSVGGAGTVQNAGPISLSGGTGSNGNGGNGGQLNVWAGEEAGAYLHNSGAIATRGGNGTLSGGSGGGISVYLNNVGDLLNSGAIDASGGDSTGTDELVAGYGGQGAQVRLYGYGGRLMSSGPIAADGGDVATLNPESQGGRGGYVEIESYPDYWTWTSPAGAMEISGNISARGGSGPSGGSGGAVYVYYEDSTGTGGIVLRGYSNLVNDGGDGVTNGGRGGGMWLWDSSYESAAETAGIVTEADLSANGGDATDASGYGGDGGYVELCASINFPEFSDITADGGAGANPGGPGSIYIDGGSGPE